MIRAHLLTHRIDIEREVVERDRFGAATSTWGAVATLWAQRVSTSSRDFLRAAGEGTEALAIYRVRAPLDVRLSDRIKDGADEFDIIELVDLNRTGIELRCRGRQ